MAFDNETRNRLKSFVSSARVLLSEEFTRQLQNTYGMNPTTGEIDALSRLTHLDPSSREIAQLLRTTVEHYRATSPTTTTVDLLDRIVREQAFTVINRICALRLAEARGIFIESIARGYQSKGFQLYARVANGALGDTAETYRAYLLSVFDELAVDLPVLFYRYSPQGRLFPGDTALLALLELINNDDLAPLWTEDETIGWIYQYFNSVEERKKMRDESSAPRNSREMAVRNQFFTPRYVVEFLTDNTLGRTWFEMRKGQTSIVEQCRYFVRRPSEIFLAEGQEAPADTEDTSNLSQEELWKRPVYTLHREQKDPRDLKVLDPATGSGHFLLYAFDLLETIYREAWEQQITTPSDVTGRTLHEDYPTEESLRRAVPELILRHNLHGVDIDPRAVQIAGLALWLRAQKAWQVAGVKPADRPSIRRSNLVVAEPMPGEQDLLNEFLKDLKPALLGRLVRQVFESMKLAGEAGTLLRVEDELQQEIEKAKREWHALQKKTIAGVRLGRQDDLFAGASPEQLELELRSHELMQISSERFWKDTEERVLNLLRDYAEQAESDTGTRRRLFADDAAKGFAFVDLCRTKFDVVVMNPPFGDASEPSKPYIAEAYGDTKGDVYKTFVECYQDRMVPAGMLGIISSRTGFFLSQSADWRERVVSRLYRPTFVADFGHGVLDAMVETAAYVLRSLSKTEHDHLCKQMASLLRAKLPKADPSFTRKQFGTYMGAPKSHQIESDLARLLASGAICIKDEDRSLFELRFLEVISTDGETSPPIVFFDTISGGDKGPLLRELVGGKSSCGRYTRSLGDFAGIEGSPFAYWVPQSILQAHQRFSDLRAQGFEAKQGVATGDDFTLVRCWWEVPADQILCLGDDLDDLEGRQESYLRVNSRHKRWATFAKGGAYSPFYSDLHLVLGYSIADQIRIQQCGRFGRGATHYYRHGLTWSDRTAKRFGPRIMPEGTIISVKGSGGYFHSKEALWNLLGILCSPIHSYFMELKLGASTTAKSYQVGTISSVPVPMEAILDSDIQTISKEVYTKQLTAKGIHDETTREFRVHCRSTFTIAAIKDEYCRHHHIASEALTDADKSISAVLARYYGLSTGDTDEIIGRISGQSTISDEPEEDDGSALDPNELPGIEIQKFTGCSFGRWDIRFATGEKQPPPLPDPFDPLPVCSPGMLKKVIRVQRADGTEEWREDDLPAEEPEDIPPGYPIDIPWDGILVVDPGHGRDIVDRLKRVFEVIWGEAADDRMREAAELLGQKDGDLRPWFRREFFPFHLARYSKSRRKAPIYWPLSTPSGAYTLWIYCHRLTDQTLLKAVNDFVEPKLGQVLEGINKLRQNSERSKKQEKELEDLTDLEHELKDFREELLRIARFWKPNLNDGVQITAAPLWKLFQHKPWQKILKETWTALEKGDYDWAHLAYTIWPDRVREKCKTDKSLAIAHGLEEIYIVPANSAKKTIKKCKSMDADISDTEEL